MIRIAAIGLGNRACKYLEYVKSAGGEASLVAVAEPNAYRSSLVAESFGLDDGQVFTSAEDLFASGLEIDAVIIASPDNTHYPFAMRALEMGWHVLLEKPVAANMDECLKIRDLAQRKNLIVHVCYVLRFHPLYMKMRELLHSGELGGIMSIEHVINVGLDRMAHTFVRGLWSKEADSSPIVLSKVSHDMDILTWISGEKAEEVFSDGSLEVYTSENAPEEAAGRCIDCPLEKNCRFSAIDLYLRRGEWNNGFNPRPSETREEAIMRKMHEGRFGRCVYKCDNDVLDYQHIEIRTKNGATIHVTMDGRTDKDSRETVVKCERGVVSTDGISIEVMYSDERTERFDMSEYRSMPFHGGADLEIVKRFLAAVEGKTDSGGADIASSIHSHELCFLAEESRKSGTWVRCMH